MTTQAIGSEPRRPAKIGVNSAGLVLGLLLGGWHLLWALLVAGGIAQPLINFIFWGAAFALLWNRVHRA